MGYKKCGICGVTNKKRKITIFDMTKKERVESDHNFDFICEHHFHENDMYLLADGRKR